MDLHRIAAAGVVVLGLLAACAQPAARPATPQMAPTPHLRRPQRAHLVTTPSTATPCPYAGCTSAASADGYSAYVFSSANAAQDPSIDSDFLEPDGDRRYWLSVLYAPDTNSDTRQRWRALMSDLVTRE
jgi:hypothetical protein